MEETLPPITGSPAWGLQPVPRGKGSLKIAPQAAGGLGRERSPLQAWAQAWAQASRLGWPGMRVLEAAASRGLSCPSAAPQERQEGTRSSHFLSFWPFLAVKNHNLSPAGHLETRPQWGPCSKSPSRLVTICLLPPGLILQVRGTSLLWFYCQKQEAGPGHGWAGPQEQLWSTDQPRQRKP